MDKDWIITNSICLSKTMKAFGYTMLFVVLILNPSCKSQSNIAVSDDIYKVQKSEFGDNMFVEALNLYRKQSHWLDKLEYSNKGDTIFILELPGVQGNYNFTFWNKKDTISYTNETGSFEFVNKPLFIKRMMQLVSDWDTKELEKKRKSILIFYLMKLYM